jgi:hypothetical protein
MKLSASSGNNGLLVAQHPNGNKIVGIDNGRIKRAEAWTDPTQAWRYEEQFKDHPDDPNPRRKVPPTVPRYTDCGRFQKIVIGADDPNFPSVGASTQHGYVIKQTHAGNWQSGLVSQSMPQPGDWLWKNGHVATYGGIETQGPHKGQYIIYEASLEAGNHNGHGPRKDYSSAIPFTLWGRPKSK